VLILILVLLNTTQHTWLSRLRLQLRLLRILFGHPLALHLPQLPFLLLPQLLLLLLLHRFLLFKVIVIALPCSVVSEIARHVF
jgi:hypothetical protein